MFPVPIGGFVIPSDFAPSVVFAVLYALLLPLVFWRLYDRRSRTAQLIGTCIFSTERIVVYSLRAVQARRLSWALKNGLLKYQQASFALGFIGISSDLINLTRCILVNPTFGVERWDEAPASTTKECFFERPADDEPDRPKERMWIRIWGTLANLSFMAASIPGGVACAAFNKDHWNDEKRANKVFTLRYESTAVALFLIFNIVLAALWSKKRQARASHQAVHIIWGICFLNSIVGIYRLATMWRRTSSLDSTSPGSLTSPGAKAAFYIIHCLPEWIAIATILGFNVRKTFGTGLWGDWRGADDGPKDIARREKRKAKKAAKKLEQRNTEDAEKSGAKDGIALVTRAA